MAPIEVLGIAGYRSLRNLRLDLGPLTVVTGPNGSGKSSLYRAIRLLADVAQGRVIPALAHEGGLSSALWAGPEAFSRAMKQGSEPVQGTVRRNPVSLRLGVASEEQGYAIDLGLPPSVPPSPFGRDPEIKMESLWTGRTWRRATAFAERHGPSVQIRNGRGAWQGVAQSLAPFDSMLTHCANSAEAIELLLFRETVRAWRFYDHFRTDAAAPARRHQVGTRTPALASDGADLAAAIATIMEVGADDELAEAVADGFPGTTLGVSVNDGAFEIEVRQRGLLRPLRAAELSDGTLRYLLLVAALLTPRPPPLMVFNEPETSLHRDLIPPLGRLLARAAARSQVLVISHARELVSALAGAGAVVVELQKQLGETVIPEQDGPAWAWPSR